MSGLKYKRVLLKVSGEALAGDAGRGLNFDVIQSVCDVIARCVKEAWRSALWWAAATSGAA